MITESTTVAELRRLPLSEVLAALAPDAEPAESRRYGAFGNIWVRPMLFPEAGAVIKGHRHNYDHVTWLSQGAVLVCFELPNGEVGERVYRAPAVVLIRKGVLHEITALTDDTRADCIYALRDSKTGEVIEHWDGGLEAYR